MAGEAPGSLSFFRSLRSIGVELLEKEKRWTSVAWISGVPLHSFHRGAFRRSSAIFGPDPRMGARETFLFGRASVPERTEKGRE